MATNYTSLLGLAQPTTGELAGLWGDTVNNQITALVEEAIAGAATADVTSGDWTLTTTGAGASNQARCAILIPTGTPGTSRNIIAPKQSKTYLIVNKSNGAATIKGFDTTGTSIAAGGKAYVAWDGTDFVVAGTAPGGAASFSQVNVTAQGDLRMEDNSGGEYVGLQAPSTVPSSYVLTMPTGPGSADEALTTNGSNELLWAGFIKKANGTSVGLKYTVSALGSVSGTQTLNLATANEFTATIAGATTIAFSSAPAAGESQVVYLRLTNAGSATITWPASTKFDGGTAPELTASGVDLLGVKYDSTTSTYMVFVIGLDVKVP